ncbi:FAD-dependent oxidoreductase [Clostridium carboxidivorans P7]|uniref:FAD dependent oxidoreductase n=1 Tax=Clostridium carboxidivorans P7 TaxID=536227 RepID=C6PVY3_9CLOT|nr:NAD(P)/FAD-dependent oxidoreductase [Clostridium carboxidivorans]ADO12085.1 glycerol-3-phosphate dehydrogenase [Clostridium carboxidivorans P7]AKN32770.1 FAD-dependent oxidoreductase [Clostridium carboxidivorans P7]EET86614.1 FAD dependent oxidoreductase [Clostridium carboxidivorans P7]EFG89991.1 FAD dependent oxidoreductase [Clostridium carboxidivorans P7]
MFDVTIIGTGVIGCAVARELSRYKLNTCVVEKNVDLANGTTKANSAIVHAGFDAKPETLKGKLNAKGNTMFDKLSEELDFPFKRNGSFVLCFDEKDMDGLRELKKKGEENGVPDLQILDGNEARKMEPNLSDEVVAALYAPTGGIVCPYEMTIALAENASTNGVEFRFETEVKGIEKSGEKYILKTNKGDIETKLVINAAGLFSDEINNMVSERKIHIAPRKGEYCLFDKVVGDMVSKTIFQLPTKLGKGVLVTPTVDGNLLVGPNAVDLEDKTDLTTTREGIDDIVSRAALSVKQIPMRQVITSFSGLRAHCTENDFIIGEPKDAKNFINATGIESPGLSSAPAVAEMIRDMVVAKLNPDKNADFNPIRKGIPKFREMNNEERKQLIAKDARYGKMVCRCETVTEGEIVNAIKRPLGATTLDGVKKRTRAGMGRCQSGFCSTKIVEILSRELGIARTDVTKFGGESNLLVGKDKESI